MSLRRASAVVIGGSVLGFGISLLLTPVLSRLYSPATFGLFSTVFAAATSLVGISTLRLEVRAQSSTQEEETRSLFRCAVAVAIFCSGVVAVAALLAVLMGAPSVWLGAPLIVLAGSFQIVGSSILVRRQGYRELGVANFVQGGGSGLAQVAAGLVLPHAWALVLGFLAARLAWVKSVWDVRGPVLPLRATWENHRGYAIVAGTSAGINSVSGQLIVIVPALFGGVAIAGALAMAIRLLVAPLGIIAQGVSAATIGEVGARLREGKPSLKLVDRAIRDLCAVGFVPCVGAGLLGPLVVTSLLGEEWAQTGIMLALLAPGAFAQFVGSPLGQLLNVSGESRILLRWDLTRLVTIGGALGFPLAAGLPATFAIGTYSCGQVILYFVLVALVRRTMRRLE